MLPRHERRRIAEIEKGLVLQDPDFADLPKAFGCVATELATGREVWLREGPVIDAVRASMALPGLFTPTQQEDRLLVDGGLAAALGYPL